MFFKSLFFFSFLGVGVGVGASIVLIAVIIITTYCILRYITFNGMYFLFTGYSCYFTFIDISWRSLLSNLRE